MHEEPSRSEEEEWDHDRKRHLFHAAAVRVQVRTNPVHWDAFVRTALDNQAGREAAGCLNLSPANIYVIKNRLIKEIKEEIARLGED